MKIKKYIISSVLCVLLAHSAAAFAQKNPKDSFDFPKLNEIQMPKVEQISLKNGMRLFLVEDRDYPTIDMRAMIKSGSVYEPADLTGLASITGQVWRSGGTEKMTGDQIDQKLETMAASIETGIGLTSGFASVSMLKENLDEVLEIFADILMNPVFDEEKIELSKVTMRSAISRRNDQVAQIADREFTKLVYGAKSPYARHSEYETIDAVTREDIIGFYKKFASPENIMLTVWGDFRAKDIRKKIEKAFSGWKNTGIAAPPLPSVKADYQYSVNYVHKPDIDQSNIAIGHIGGMRNNPDFAAIQVMNRILSWERLFKKIRTDEGLAYSVWGNYGMNYQTPGVFSIGAQTKSQSTVYAIELMIAEMKKLMNEPVTDEELQKSKDQYLNSYVFDFDSKAKIVNRMMTLAYYAYPLDFNDAFIRQIENVTKEDIQRVAQKYLKPDKIHILVVGNRNNFDQPLSVLGDVNEIDITIQSPAEEAPEASDEAIAAGRAVLEKAFSAMGGFEKIKSVKNYQTKLKLAQTTPMGDMVMDAAVVSILPDKMHMSLNTPQGEITMIINGEKGIMKHAMGSMPLPPQQRESMMSDAKRELYYIASNLDAFTVQYTGETVFAEKSALDLILTENGNTFHIFIDPESFLIQGISYQQITPEGPAKVEQIFSDYKSSDGIMWPAKTVSLAKGEKQGESTVLEMMFNAALDESIFEIE